VEKKTRKVLKWTGIGAGMVVLIPVLFAALIATVMSLPSIFSTNPPMPEITYGEFPFRIVYEIDGAEMVVEDVLIAEFAGTRYAGSRVRARQWSGRLQNMELYNIDGFIRVPLYEVSATIDVTATLPIAGHLMGSSPPLDGREIPVINFPRYFDEDRFRLISFEMAPPIENTFR